MIFTASQQSAIATARAWEGTGWSCDNVARTSETLSSRENGQGKHGTAGNEENMKYVTIYFVGRVSQNFWDAH